MKTQRANSWYQIKNLATGRPRVEIIDEIGYWGVNAAQFNAELRAIDATDIDVFLSTPGGSVFDGVDIYQALVDHPANIHIEIGAMAASIGSVIAMAGHKEGSTVRMHETSFLMVHNPWMLAIGNAADLRKEAELLDKLTENAIKPAYKRQLGDKWNDAQVSALLDDETWMSAEEALAYGFIDSIIEQDLDDATPASWAKGFGAYNYQKAPVALAQRFAPASTVTVNDATFPVRDVALNLGNSISTTTGGTDTVPQVRTENINQKEAEMPIPNQEPAAQGQAQAATPVVDEKVIRNEAAQAERARVKRIQNLGRQLNASEQAIQECVDSGVTVEEAIDKLTAAVQAAAPVQPLAPRVGADEADKLRDASVNKILAMHRISGSDPKALSTDAPATPQALVRVALRRSGQYSDSRIDSMSSAELGEHGIRMLKNPRAAVSTGTGDLTNILADVTNKAMGAGYEAAQTTWRRWVPVQPVSDFKNFNLDKLSAFSNMDTIGEGQPFKLGTFSDKKEYGAVTVKGKALVISMQAIVNDDMGAFVRVPRAIGASYAFGQNKDVYDFLYGASGVGPTMNEDSTAMFTTGHANYVSAGAAPSTTTLAVGRKSMMNQTAPKAEASDTAMPLNLVPRYIIHGTTLLTTSEQLLSTIGRDVAGTNSNVFQPFAPGGTTPLEIIADAYLETKTSAGWYLAADPNQLEGIVMLALNGRVEPIIRSEDSGVGEPLGVKWDIHGAYAPMAGDFRAMFFNDGAT